MDQNEKLKRAMSDVAVIKETMHESRVQNKWLPKLLFWYAGSQLIIFLIYFLFDVLFNYVFQSLGFDNLFSRSHYLVVSHLLYVLPMIIFFNMRKPVAQSKNDSALLLFDVWGYSLFAIPMIILACYALSALSFFSLKGFQSVMMKTVLEIAEHLSFFLGIAVMGFILKSKGWKIFSIVCTTVYFLSFYWSGMKNDHYDVTVETLSSWRPAQMGWMILCPVIAIIIGIYLLPDRKKEF